jgi:hypothetical protein
MASPVIFDDGGSTRIKRLIPNGPGAMNALLDVDMTLNPAQSTETVAGPFTKIRVVSIDHTGFAATPVDSALRSGDSFSIASENGQNVTGDIDGAGQCVITVLGSANNPPLMEAKQFKKRRRYIVANAGPIATIDAVLNGVPVHFAAAAGTIYSTLVIS